MPFTEETTMSAVGKSGREGTSCFRRKVFDMFGGCFKNRRENPSIQHEAPRECNKVERALGTSVLAPTPRNRSVALEQCHSSAWQKMWDVQVDINELGDQKRSGIEPVPAMTAYRRAKRNRLPKLGAEIVRPTLVDYNSQMYDLLGMNMYETYSDREDILEAVGERLKELLIERDEVLTRDCERESEMEEEMSERRRQAREMKRQEEASRAESQRGCGERLAARLRRIGLITKEA